MALMVIHHKIYDHCKYVTLSPGEFARYVAEMEDLPLHNVRQAIFTLIKEQFLQVQEIDGKRKLLLGPYLLEAVGSARRLE